MGASNLEEQLTKYLADAHSIEEQALAQLRAAPKIAGEPKLEEIFQQHLSETERQEQMIRQRLEAHGGSPSAIKEVVMRAGGAGFVLFAKSQPDTPGKLTAHAYSYEHLELASYELLSRVAERAGDQETAGTARSIRDEEQAMAERLEACFDAAAEASLRDQSPDDLKEQVVKYLADAHAIENQAIQLLQQGTKVGGDAELERLYAGHLEETRQQQKLVEERLEALGGSPSKLKDAAMRLGAINWGGFFAAQPDTPGKLAGFAYAFEHLEIAGYELLKRVAQRAGDQDTVTTCDQILAQERAAAGKIAAQWDRAVEASLSAQGVTA